MLASASKEWERRRGITRRKVEDVLRKPEQIVPGDRGVLVAQAKLSNGLLRVAFLEVEGGRRILTLYWTSKVEKYWA